MFSTRTHIRLFSTAVCASAIAVGTVAAPAASAAAVRPGQTTTWAYEADLFNSTYSTLDLVGAVPAIGSTWVTPPPKTLAPGQKVAIEVRSTQGSAGAVLTYADPANGGVLTITGQANSTPNGSYSYADATGRLGATGPSGYFSGVNPDVAAQYTIAAMP